MFPYCDENHDIDCSNLFTDRLCLQAPRSAAKKVENINYKDLLSLADTCEVITFNYYCLLIISKVNIPVIVIFTEYDILIREVKAEYRKETHQLMGTEKAMISVDTAFDEFWNVFKKNHPLVSGDTKFPALKTGDIPEDLAVFTLNLIQDLDVKKDLLAKHEENMEQP